MKKKAVVTIAGIAVFVIFITVAVINSNKGPKFDKNAIPVEYETVKNSSIISKIDATGKVELKNKDSLYTDVPLTVKDVLVKQGDAVHKGQVLVTYFSRERDEILYQLEETQNSLNSAIMDFQSIAPGKPIGYDFKKNTLWVNENEEIRQSEIKIKQAQRSLATAQDKLKNYKILYEEGNISRDEFTEYENDSKSKEEDLQTLISQKKAAVDRITNQAKTKQNEINAAELKIRELKNKIRRYVKETISSNDGTVVTFSAEQGKQVDINNPVAEVADPSNLLVKVDLSEFDAPKVVLGQEVELTLQYDETTVYKGMVARISPVAVNKKVGSQDGSVVEVEIAFSDKTGKMKPGYSIDTRIITARKENVPTVSLLSILKEKDGREFVYVIKNDNKIEKRYVKTGAYSDLYTEVPALKEGEKIVLNPSQNVVEGISVKPIQKKNSTNTGEKK